MWVPLLWGAGCTRQGRKTFLTRGLSVSGNFDLGTPNSVHGYTLARPTWRSMKKGAGVHCARAVHVQMFCFCSSFAAPTGQTDCAADAKLAGHMSAIPAYMFLWLPFVWGAGCARQERKSLFARGPPVLGNVHLLTPNLVHLWKSMSVIRWCMPLGDGVHSARAIHVHLYAYA